MKVEVTHKNGVNAARLQEMIGAIQASPELARFNLQLQNRWIGGGENRSQVRPFYGCVLVMEHKADFHLVADEPEILLGGDKGAKPVEHLLHALVSCVTTSMVYHAGARGIEIEEVESSLDGDLDLRGFLGLDPSVRNGYQQILLEL